MRALRIEGPRERHGAATGSAPPGFATMRCLALAPLAGSFGDARLRANWGVLLNHHFFDLYSAGAQLARPPDHADDRDCGARRAHAGPWVPRSSCIE